MPDTNDILQAIDNLQRKTIITEEELHRVTKRLEEREAQMSVATSCFYISTNMLIRYVEVKTKYQVFPEVIY